MDREMYDEKDSSYFAGERREMLPFVPAEARTILDVGCATGCFGQALKTSRTLEVWGIELMPAAAAVAQTKLDHVVEGTYDAALPQLPKRYFDCLIFNDVLEHMENPYRALDLAHTVLAPNGVVVASLPNIRYLPVLRELVWNGRWDYVPSGILDRTHLRFFTRQNILEMFTEHGFAVECLVGINAKGTGIKFKFLNALLGGRFDDTPFLQFAVRARSLR